MKLNKIFTVKKSVSKDDFLRAALIELATNEKTPTDILDAKFKEIEEYDEQIIGFSAHLDAEYDCSVGYERREEYWDKEKKTKNGQTYYVDVKKTRTVVDWKPHHGKTSGNISCLVFNREDSYIDDDDYIVSVLKKVPDKDFKNGGDIDLTDGGLESAKSIAQTYLEFQTKFPGDKHEDVSMRTNFDIKHIDGYIVPSYQLEYVYNGKTFKFIGLAVGRQNVRCSSLPEKGSKNFSKADSQTRNYKILAIVFGVLQAVTFVLGCMSVIPVIPQWVWWVAWAPLLAAMIIFIVLRIKIRQRIERRLDKEDANKKISDLNRILKEKKLKPYINK